jgi:hypothetical protein
MATVTIACAVPNGLHIDIDEFGNPVVLNGAPPQNLNPGNIPTIGFSTIDSDVWDAWAANAGAAFIAAGVVWEV